MFNVGVNYGGPRYPRHACKSATRARPTGRTCSTAATRGSTDAFTLVNGSFGVKWGEKRNIVTMLKVTNLLNEEIQQHIFGDISKLQMVGELRVGF